MNQERRKELVTMAKTLRPRWHDSVCTIGGWKNSYASLSPDSGGFWGIKWEALERVLLGQSTLDREHIWFISGAWLGIENP